MELKTITLRDVHDHSVAVDGWRQVYRQMTPGAFESTLLQAIDTEFSFFRETTNRRVVQEGVAPKAFSSIAVPLREPIVGTFQGQLVDGYALLTLRGGENFQFFTPEAMNFIGVSVPNEKLDALVGSILGESAASAFRSNVLRLDAMRSETARQQLCALIGMIERNAAALASPAVQKKFKDEVLSLVLTLLEDSIHRTRGDLTHRTYSDIVRRSEKLLTEYADEPVTVLDLCDALGVSRRTLQTSFQRVANVTPVQYLRATRLNHVRALLRSTSADELFVGDAAARWGFSHLGYFAREYRELFGELPSQTRRLG
jgi:AraC-like DNA-binding protein